MGNKPVFNSVIILTFTMLFVKVLSAIYRVPYQNILGDTGLYAYQQVYPLIAIVSVLSLNAIPSVVSQSQYDTLFMKQLRNVLTIISVLILGLIVVFSKHIAFLMGDIELKRMLQVSALVLLPFPFVALARGQLQRKHQMEHIAVSQVIEQIVRVTTILFAITLFVKADFSVYESGSVSIFGSFLGLTAAYIYLKVKGFMHLESNYQDNEGRTYYLDFLTLIFFYSLSYLVLILWQLVDSFTMINQLKQIMSLNEARELKGVYDRGSSLIQVGLIVTTSFSLVLIPVLAECRAKNALTEMKAYADSALKITIVFSSAAAVGLMNLIRPLNLFLFETITGYEALAIYMLSVIFVSLIIMFTAMLQIYNAFRIQLVAVIAGILTKFLLNLLLIPQLDIKGASIATVAGLVTYTLCLYYKVQKIYELKLNTFIRRWLLVLIVMSIAIQCILVVPFNTRLTAMGVSIMGVTIGLAVVLYTMVKWKIISVQEWYHLPFGNIMIKLMKG
ncbi:polysaccharide biosynthesis protein [Macrococcoides caseolyticum subsp. caseolyticum]|uniref:polysaccharide biosynthesis protein n=1 Tax=Macrococcoides caseolyticum TaxID=69966 RepID=UPI000CCFED83|nr:polysaccharide biosynthesis protein [Macrococcus caseolyticus]PNZ74286.1 polysaccharide biosynthesis protein [Macrococcus caseolyticus]QPT46289.1 polysaccharide biosynthesis protein [Macrococcus caseolyticus]RAK44845.1 polysaccharide biosynthesis protein [Macrococcus caseolyticus subsp. caseolyticus]TDM28588.1 polysaccharide biosynthesis protein [Macrococcus caseolyticus]HCD19855.1 polysaccharide biosynthesis protein [Macrococcus caseolyticus]